MQRADAEWRKYGFKRIDSAASDIEVDWDEQLVDDSQIKGEEDRWII